ncbi:hypothetical protein ACKI10_44140 [Streptomyces galilaeus]|uniref:Uncharacterized protein n=1 Tax=Streptomyces galilaeus TaxID=33899 RepID=A0ABW9IXL7_STRGJ
MAQAQDQGGGGAGGLELDLHRSRLCVVVVDRLTFGGHIIGAGSELYRLAHTKARH